MNKRLIKIFKKKPMSFKLFCKRILGIKTEHIASLEQVYSEEANSNYPYERGYHD